MLGGLDSNDRAATRHSESARPDGAVEEGEGARPGLRRSLSLSWLTLYGLGTTIGAGIYALSGEVARSAGMQAPLAFVGASLLAAFSAASFAELGSRFPRSAGEAVYVREGFGRRGPATAVGLLVVLAGSVSAATLADAFAGYAAELVRIPGALAVLLLVASLGGLAGWGIRESVAATALLTLVEVGGLLLVVAAGADRAVAELPARWRELALPSGAAAWTGVGTGALLAFYAFLGFEDMVNVAEEVRSVRRTLPLAIALTLLLTTALYVLLESIAVLAVPPAQLAESSAPLVLVYERSGGRWPAVIGMIGVLAMLNGALVQIIMASRVLYGLAGERGVPGWLGRVHPRTRTPLFATASVAAVVLVLALLFPLRSLAETTSAITLLVFATVNGSLLRIHRRPAPPGAFVCPRWVPLAGLVVSLGFLVLRATALR
jgi:APA family basic amino acid/polyamine antiporter